MGEVKFRELRVLEDDGWQLVAQRGSHQQYEHPSKPGKVTEAGPPRADVPKAPQRIFFRQAGCGGDQAVERLSGRDRARSESWGAYCPDLPGVGVVGDSQEEVEQLTREAIALHLDGLRKAGEPIPEPTAVGTTLVEVPAA